MSEEDKGTGHKLGIGAAILAALGGFARFADDCGRVAVHTGGAADDLARVGKPGVGLVDDVARGAKPGAGLVDDVGRASRPGLAAAAPAGEGSLLRVADDVAPGAGTSLEESLIELGIDVGFEIVTLDLPDGGDDYDDVVATAPAAKPRMLAAATWRPAKAEFESLPRGEVVGVVVATDAAGTFAFGDERITESVLHQRCHARGVRCVVASCVEDAVPGCLPLAGGIGRMAAERVSPTDTPRRRVLQLAEGMIRQRDRLKAREITLSRLDVRGENIVRSKLGAGAPTKPRPPASPSPSMSATPASSTVAPAKSAPPK